MDKIQNTLTLPQNAAVCLTNKLHDLPDTFVRQNLCISEETFIEWLDGLLPIALTSLIQILKSLSISPQEVLDDLPELTDIYTQNNLTWRLLIDCINEQGLLLFIAKNEQLLTRIIQNFHPTPLPLAKHLHTVKDKEHITIQTTDNATITISQEFNDWHIGVGRIAMTPDNTIYTKFISGHSEVINQGNTIIEIKIPFPCQITLFIHSDDAFSVSLEEKLNNGNAQEILTLQPLTLNDFISV